MILLHAKFKLGLCILAALSMGTVAAVAQPSRQSTKGLQRLCVYDDARNMGRRVDRSEESDISAIDPRDRLNPRESRTKVGLGEPCPAFPNSPRQEAEAPTIPSMASLIHDTSVNGRRVCVYGYLGHRYEHPLDASRSCPLTPTFLY